MRTRVQKWGHSLAIRIPKSFAEEAGLEENVPVEMSLAEGKLLIEPIAKGDLTLHDLLDGVTDENLHGEIPTGPAVGNQVW
jgi:antitoxin MazE